MARVITGFESDSPSVKEDDREYDYVMVFTALPHSMEVASNVFARCAKRHFRSVISSETKMVMANEVDELLRACPLFYVEGGIALPVTDDKSKHEGLATELSGLVGALADTMETQYSARVGFKDPSLALVGPLFTQIRQVGEGLFSFVVKQRWSVHVGEA